MNYDLIKRLLQLDSHPESAPFQAAERIKALESRAEKAEDDLEKAKEENRWAYIQGALDERDDSAENPPAARTAYTRGIEDAAKVVAERDALREAFTHINAMDPEHRIDSFSDNALRGLVLEMGRQARAALNLEKDDE